MSLDIKLLPQLILWNSKTDLTECMTMGKSKLSWGKTGKFVGLRFLIIQFNSFKRKGNKIVLRILKIIKTQQKKVNSHLSRERLKV